MGNEQLLFTVRFAGWEDAGHKFPPFGVRYILEIPSELEDEGVEEYFMKKFEEKIGRKFDGDILFVEPMQIVTL